MDPRLCILCRGARYLCGKAYCPILAKSLTLIKVSRVIESTEVEGSSPPSIFVGRIGYPKVLVGPATPPEHGNTAIYDLPEMWLDKPLEQIIAMRSSLIIARKPIEVTDIESRFVQALHELVLSLRPIDLEIVLEKPPRPRILFSDYEPPMGPRAPIKTFRIVGSGSSLRIVERVYSDTDLRAREAVIELYRHGVPVTHIQRMFSIGALGRGRSRRLVPTRWAITAVDSVISEYLIQKVRDLPELNRVMLFVRKVRGNLFAAILLPGRWSFEWMEAWFPGSTWNPHGNDVVIEGDYELYMGRDTYPSIGGCYYASRLATAEFLLKIGRQGVAVVLREIYPGFNIPIGVWFVRENVRAMYKSEPRIFDDLREALHELDEHSRLGSSTWIQHSRLLKRVLFEKRLLDFIVK